MFLPCVGCHGDDGICFSFRLRIGIKKLLAMLEASLQVSETVVLVGNLVGSGSGTSNHFITCGLSACV